MSAMPATPRREGFLVGFYGALGVACLGLLLIACWFLLGAIITIITPFLVAVVVALMLDPVVDRVQRGWGRGRRLPAVLVVYLAFLLAFALLLAFVVPILVGQAQRLATHIPGYFETVRTGADVWLRTHRQIGPVALPPDLDTLVAEYSDQVAGALRASVRHIAGIVLGSVSRLLSIVLIPIITFYLLLDIDRLRARLLFLMPERYRAGVQRTALDVSGVFGDYVRGLLLVCFFYAAASVTALLLLGLKAYALLLGVAAGVLYAVPYVGALVTVLLTAIVTLATGHAPGYALLVAGAMVLLNQVFDNVITPRVVGGGVGLHPVLALFALLLGGQLFGLWGMLLSVPIAASIQVVLYRLLPRLATPTPVLFLLAEGAVAQRRAAVRSEQAPDDAASVTPPAE